MESFALTALELTLNPLQSYEAYEVDGELCEFVVIKIRDLCVLANDCLDPAKYFECSVS